MLNAAPLMPSISLGGTPRGSAAVAKYNPHLLGANELRAIFVARIPELDQILDALRSASKQTQSAPQHMLITGQRGMGKTTLLQRVALAVEEDTALASTWLPLRFPEDQYTLSTPAELWANVTASLADALQRHGLSTLKADQQLMHLGTLPIPEREAHALQWLEQWCKQHQRRLLLLIDSTDLVFSNIARADSSSDGTSALWRVRKTLSHAPHFFWLGGSYQPLETNGLYSDAFLDFFHLIELRTLTVAQMQAAILALARTFGAGRGLQGESAEAEVKRLLTQRPERLRAMRQLTGGNPRTTIMLYTLFAAGGEDSVRADLDRLLDDVTPLYKARFEVLPEQSRKVLAHLMEYWAPISAKNLAGIAALGTSTVSAQLSRLEQEGLIEKVPLEGTKRHGFQVSERFFNIWHLMRNSQRVLRLRLGWLVEFMRMWYSNDERSGMAQRRGREHRGGTLCDAGELEYSRALSMTLHNGDPQRDQLEWTVFKQARNNPALAELFDLKGVDAALTTPENYLGRFEALGSLLRQCPHCKDATAMEQWTSAVMSSISLNLSEKEHTAKVAATLSHLQYTELVKTFEKERQEFLTLYGAEAQVVFQATMEGNFFPDFPDSKLGWIQMESLFLDKPAAFRIALDLFSNKHQDSWLEKALNKAILLQPHDAVLRHSLGQLFQFHLKRYNEAEVAYRQAIAVDPKFASSWVNLGHLFKNQLKRYDEAEETYLKAIALDAKSAYPWIGLGNLLQDHLKRYEEAEAAYRQAIVLDSSLGSSWSGLGKLLQHHLKRYEEAEAAYQQAIALDAKLVSPWSGLGNLLQHHLKRYEEAEAAYRKAIAMDAKYAYPWDGLGNLLRNHSTRYDEAEAAYRRAIALDANFAFPWVGLGHLLKNQLQRYDEAEAAYRQAIALDPKLGHPWNSLGDLLQDHLKRFSEAEAAYRQAMQIDAKEPYPKANLARLMARQGNLAKASALYRDVTNSAIDSNAEVMLQAHCWLGNDDLALQALTRLAQSAASGNQLDFYRIEVQCFECHALGISPKLADLMDRSPYAGFLQSFSVALRLADGQKDAGQGIAVEVRAMAQEVLERIRAEPT
jgi:tetratricopeptide (TPR) repeat protein